MKKDISLEAVRGVAAISVVVWHCLRAFYPGGPASGTRLIEPHLSNPLFVLLNGNAAVEIFFVLSGYVLTRKYFLTGDAGHLLKGIVKRWPRLAGPVLLAIMASFALFHFHLYFFHAAGMSSGSSWLTQFGMAPSGPPTGTFFDALLQGALFVFFRGNYDYDPPLWTMQPEIFGSFIVLATAPLILEARRISRLLVVGLVGAGILLSHFSMPFIAAFFLGLGISALIGDSRRLHRIYALPLALIAFCLLNFVGAPQGLYRPFAFVPWVAQRPFYVEMVGAALLIFLIESSPGTKRLLSGRFAAFLGRLSFPIYLVHFLVIASVGSWAYLHWGAPAAMAISLAGALVAALPLILFNEYWVRAVDRFARIILKPAKGGSAALNPENNSLIFTRPETVPGSRLNS